MSRALSSSAFEALTAFPIPWSISSATLLVSAVGLVRPAEGIDLVGAVELAALGSETKVLVWRFGELLGVGGI